MKVIVKVERLWMNNEMYRTGDVLDISEDEIARLGTSVERDVPTVEKLDERDAEINMLKAKIEELEIAIAVASTTDGSEVTKTGDVAEVPTDEWVMSAIKQYLDDAEIEYGARMSKPELLELVNSRR